jgi:hypothetical protein
MALVQCVRCYEYHDESEVIESKHRDFEAWCLWCDALDEPWL